VVVSSFDEDVACGLVVTEDLTVATGVAASVDEFDDPDDFATAVVLSSAPLVPSEPVLVWAETVVLSSASLLDPVDVEDVEDVEDDSDEEDDVELPDATVVAEVEVEGAVAAESEAEPEPAFELESAEEAALELDDSEPLEPDDEDEDEPASSASATPTWGPTSAAPNSAALSPAEAAPTCNHCRTPKSWDRRPWCRRRRGPLSLAIISPSVNCWELSYTCRPGTSQLTQTPWRGEALTAAGQPVVHSDDERQSCVANALSGVAQLG
jgi:hypothetical protein